jgi:hypothetical protein
MSKSVEIKAELPFRETGRKNLAADLFSPVGDMRFVQ